LTLIARCWLTFVPVFMYGAEAGVAVSSRDRTTMCVDIAYIVLHTWQMSLRMEADGREIEVRVLQS